MRDDVKLVSEDELAALIINAVNSKLEGSGNSPDMSSISIYRLQSTDPVSGANWSVGYSSKIQDISLITEVIADAQKRLDLR